jgi:ribonuclease J
VILSSKAIPGNEEAIYRNIDNIFRQGARVIYGEQAGLHVSGHAAQEELKLLLNLLRPRYFVPLHGAYRMLHTHAQIAYELGYGPEDVFVLNNGDSLELTEQGVQVSEPISLQDIYVDGSLVGDVGHTILRDRMALSQDGFVIAKVTVDMETGDLLEEPEIISQGFVYVPESADLLSEAEAAMVHMVKSEAYDSADEDELARRIKRRLERLFYDRTRRRPVIIPMVNSPTDIRVAR